ncbi:norsolorinic acid ketoreductase [Microdochium nivale]|nr:norsolorinic acid ketoreductase [Microdochium nivale]
MSTSQDTPFKQQSQFRTLRFLSTHTGSSWNNLCPPTTMPSYLITGASGSIGFEFVRQASANPDNIVIGLVRNKTKMDGKVASELPNRTNVHVVEGELSDYTSLARSVDPVSKITGGSLDYLIANAASMSTWSEFKPYEEQAKEPAKLTAELDEAWTINVVSNIHLFNLYLPLLRQSSIRKVVAISSGHADTDLVLNYRIDAALGYTVTKAALNMVVAKYHASYGAGDQAILFMSMCPGMVENEQNLAEPTEDAIKYGPAMFAKFAEFAPHFKGPVPPAGPVGDILRIAEQASLADGWGGSFTSHNGGKQWL